MTTPKEIEVRLFTPDEWVFYRGVRLKALKTDPAVFGSAYEKEFMRPDDAWQEALARDDLGVFGIFHYGDVIGMTGIYIDSTDPAVAGLWGSWLEPAWRGKGISEKMYEARINWAREHPSVKRIRVSHRESNTASKAANQKHGFKFTHARDKIWSDGVSEPELFYELAVK